jgi:membrane-bound serine protease (ClpP class)
LSGLDWGILGLVIVLIIAFVTFIVLRTVTTYRRQATTGKEDLIGKIAEVKETLDPEGMILYQGDLWNAISESGRIESGEEVVITKVEGLMLRVTKIAKE